MTKVTREQRRQGRDEPLPPSLRAELKARVGEAASRRNGILEEAKRQRTATERTATQTYDRIKASAQAAFEVERAAIRDEIDRRAAGQ